SLFSGGGFLLSVLFANSMNTSLTLWLVWCAYWIISARQRMRDTDDSPARREPLAGRLAYIGLMVAGFALLVRHLPVSYLEERLWPSVSWWAVAGLVIQAVGLGSAVWARRTLGSNW